MLKWVAAAPSWTDGAARAKDQAVKKMSEIEHRSLIAPLVLILSVVGRGGEEDVVAVLVTVAAHKQTSQRLCERSSG